MSLSYRHVDGGDGAHGQLRYKTWDVTFDSAYVTGGEPIDLSGIGLSNLIGGVCLGALDATSAAIVPMVDFDNNKLLAMQSSVAAHTHPLLLKNAAVADGATTRVNAGTNLLGANTGSDITVAGGGANGGVQANTASNAGLVEVGSGVNLSAVTVRMMFYGN